MGRHLFIVNSRSGGGRAPQKVAALLKDIMPLCDEFETMYTDAPGSAAVISKEESCRYNTLIAVGGDGTVSEVAEGLIAAGSPDTRLAILPIGTGNDAARTLGVGDWDSAVAALRGDTWRAIDACRVRFVVGGETRERVALVGVGIGLPARVIATATERVKHVLGRFAYTYAAVKCALTYRCPRMRIEADGRIREGLIFLCAVANTEYTAGHTMRMAPGALCDDGWLNLLLARRTGRARLLSGLPSLCKGTHLARREVEHFRARVIAVESEPLAEVTVDGDLSGTTPVCCEVLAGALKVKVP